MARTHRSEIGWLGEQAVDQANVAGSGGRLVPWIPLIDSHGVDRAYSWDGVGAPMFAQVKTSAYADAHGRHHWYIRTDALQTHDRFVVVLAVFQRATGRPADVYWCLDASAVRRLGQRGYDSALRADVYHLDASPINTDRLTPYRHSRDTLWTCFSPSDALASSAPLGFPRLHLDEGAVYEFAEIGELLAANHEDLLLFRPAFDVHGRDLLIQLVGSCTALYLQIKGTARPQRHDVIRFEIARSTFIPADDFWLACLLWDLRQKGLFPEQWLVPSTELQSRSAGERDPRYLHIYTHVDPAHDRWATRRHPINDVATVVRTALADLRLAA